MSPLCKPAILRCSKVYFYVSPTIRRILSLAYHIPRSCLFACLTMCRVGSICCFEWNRRQFYWPDCHIICLHYYARSAHHNSCWTSNWWPVLDGTTMIHLFCSKLTIFHRQIWSSALRTPHYSDSIYVIRNIILTIYRVHKPTEENKLAIVFRYKNQNYSEGTVSNNGYIKSCGQNYYASNELWID